jgi:hypothetical protein
LVDYAASVKIGVFAVTQALAQDDYDKRYALLLATTPALQADGWRDLDSAPHDGTTVEIRVVNYLAPTYADDRDFGGYVGVCRAHWIEHNGGGFTWYGLCGAPSHWRPLKH